MIESQKKITTIYIDSDVLKAFKTVCVREDVSVSKKLETLAARYAVVHGEGNTQRMLSSFIKQSMRECFLCETLTAKLYRTRFISGLIANVCKGCLDEETQRTTVKKVLGVLP